MARLMLSDELWSKLRAILRQHGIYDKSNLRLMVEAMLYRMRVDCPWRGLGGWAGVPIHRIIRSKSFWTCVGCFIAPHALNEKIRFYRMAKRSATETAAILDVSKRLNIIHEDNYQTGRDLLIRIVMMLTKRAQKSDWSDSVTRSY